MRTTQANHTQAKFSAFRNLAFITLIFQPLLSIFFASALKAQTIPPQVAWVEAAGVDVEVTLLAGSPVTTSLLDVVVTSPACGEVARHPVAALAAEVTTVLPHVLGSVLSCGTQYTVLLEDLNGTVVSPPLPFQVRLQCDSALLCDYRLAPGIEVDNGLVISQDLDQALIQAGGQGNLVDAVSNSHPQLRDEVLTYAFHLDRLLASQNASLTSVCNCQWNGSVDNSQIPGTGPFHPYSVHASPASPTDIKVGSTTLGVSPVCHNLSVGSATTLLLPSGPILTIPAFKRCTPAGSPPEVTGFQLTFEGRAQAWGPLGYAAEASFAVDFHFDGIPHTSASAMASKSHLEAAFPNSQPLSLDSGVVFANQATVFTTAAAEVKPITWSPFCEEPAVGAEAGGTLTLEASGGLNLFQIKLSELTKFKETVISDSPDEGEDVEICHRRED